MTSAQSVLTIIATSALFAAPALAQGPVRGGGQPERNGQAEALVNRLMASDANKDGKLTLEEMDERFGQMIMDRADKNKDGFVTKEEIIAMVEARPGPGAAPRPANSDANVGGGDDGDANEEISFHDAMEQAGRGLRGFRRSPMDETSREADLRAVQTIQLGLLFAKARVDSVEMSDESKKIFGTNEAAHKVALRLGLIRVIMKALELESALAEGESEKSKEIFASIRELRADAHDLFEQEEEDHDEEPGDRPGGRDGGGEGRGGRSGGEG